MTRFLLVRHGQTDWNRGERFRGRADLALNTAGLAQAEAVGRRIAVQWQPIALYSSPLRRAVQTAEAIGRHTGLPVQPHAGLLDIDFGAWQGLSVAEARQRWPEQIDAWNTTPGSVQIPGGECLADVRARGMAAISALAAHHEGQAVVLVGHMVINRAILLGTLGLDNNDFWRLRQDTCAINIIEVDGGQYTLVTMNDTCHLAGDYGSVTAKP